MNSSSFSNTIANDSLRSLTSTSEYETISSSQSKHIWAGYDTREEFLMMHLR